MTEVKRKAGRPKKVLSSDPKAIVEKIEKETAKADASLADNLGKVYKQLENAAITGKLNGQAMSLKDHIGLLKWCTERLEKRADEFHKEQSAEGKTGTEDAAEDELETVPLISLTAPAE